MLSDCQNLNRLTGNRGRLHSAHWLASNLKLTVRCPVSLTVSNQQRSFLSVQEVELQCQSHLSQFLAMSASSSLRRSGSRSLGNFRFQHTSQNCWLTVHEYCSLYEHSSSMVCHLKQSIPSSRLLWWRRSTTPHQPGGDFHLLTTVVAWRHSTAAAPVSATATTIQPLPACVMKLTNDFSPK